MIGRYFLKRPPQPAEKLPNLGTTLTEELPIYLDLVADVRKREQNLIDLLEKHGKWSVFVRIGMIFYKVGRLNDKITVSKVKYVEWEG